MEHTVDPPRGVSNHSSHPSIPRPAGSTPTASHEVVREPQAMPSAMGNSSSTMADKAAPSAPLTGQKVQASKTNTQAGPASPIKPTPVNVPKAMTSDMSSKSAPNPKTHKKAEPPRLWDGKTRRLVWQPSDGDGNPDPKIIEGTGGKKAGHPTWRLYAGGGNDTHPPRFVYLDDKAVFDVVSSKKWSVHDRQRYWPYDFIGKGTLSVRRANRGRPAYQQDGQTVAWVKTRNGTQYQFRGGPSSPKAGASNASTAARANTNGNSTLTADQPGQLARTTGSAQVDVVATKQSLQGKDSAQTSDSPSTASQSGAGSNSESPIPNVPEPTSHTRPGLSRPASSVLRTPQPTDSSASPTPSLLKRSTSSTSHKSPAPRKRQRKALTPYDIPAAERTKDVEMRILRQSLAKSETRGAQRFAENTHLQQEVTTLQTQLLESNRLRAESEKKGKIFREVAQQLYARAIDQQGELAERHAATVALLRDASELRDMADRVARNAWSELGPMHTSHGQIDALLDRAESSMKEQGLEEEFELFVNEAMELDSDE